MKPRRSRTSRAPRRRLSSRRGVSPSGRLPSSSHFSSFFRDGVNPGTGSGIAPDAERSTAIRPKKVFVFLFHPLCHPQKSRKRPSIVRRVTELKLEDELTCYLPAEETQPLIVRTTHGSFENQTWEETAQRIHEGSLATVVVRKNLLCTVQASTGLLTGKYRKKQLFSFGDRDLLRRKQGLRFGRPGRGRVHLEEEGRGGRNSRSPRRLGSNITGLRALYPSIIPFQIFRSALDGDSSGVQQVVSRFPRIHSSSQTAYPLPKHIYFYRPTSQVSFLPILPPVLFQQFGPLKVPSTPFLVACFLADSELSWIMACPNRVLFRLGLKYGCRVSSFLFTILLFQSTRSPSSISPNERPSSPPRR